MLTVLEIAIGLSFSSRWCWMLASGEFRRLFPRIHLALAVLAGGCLGLWTAVAWLWPEGLHFLTLILLAVWGGRLALDRRGTGLPPGDRSLARSIEALFQRDFYCQSAGLWGPIFKMSQFHRSVICLVGLERAQRLLQQHGASLAPCPLPFHYDLCAGFLRYMEPSKYGFYGPLFRKALSRQVMSSCSQDVRTAVQSHLTQLRRSQVALGEALENLTLQAFLRCLFGLRPEQPEYARFSGLYREFARQSYGQRPTQATRQLLSQLCQTLDDLDPDRFPPCALAELRQLNPAMPDRACLENLIYVTRMSTTNVTGLLEWMLVLLAENPHWWERLKQAEDPDLAERIVLETLRLHQSEYLYRRIQSEFRFEGYRFPAGWLLRVCVWESHRDPWLFPQPERFDPDRFLAPVPIRHFSPFGMLEHACNGVSLNGLICRTVLEEISQHSSLELLERGRPTRDFRHWSHWRPTSRYRLR